jgi:integrase
VCITLARHEQERVIPLTVEQVRDLADHMPARCRAMILTQVRLGLRFGELLALRVQEVDFLRRTVRIDWQLEGATRRRVPPKTPRSCRTLPLPGFVADTLAAHIAAFPPLDDGSLFSDATSGRPWRADYSGTRVLGKARRAAGLPTATSSHDLRHHYTSVASRW